MGSGSTDHVDVAVDTSGGTPLLHVMMDSGTVHFEYTRITDNNKLHFEYEVQSTDYDTNGYVTSYYALFKEGATIKRKGS